MQYVPSLLPRDILQGLKGRGATPHMKREPILFKNPIMGRDEIELRIKLTDAGGTDADDEADNTLDLHNRAKHPNRTVIGVFVGANKYDAAAQWFQEDRRINPTLPPVVTVLGTSFDSDKTPRKHVPSCIDGKPISLHKIPGYYPNRFDGSGKAIEGSGYTGFAVDAVKLKHLKSGKFTPLSLEKFVNLQEKILEGKWTGKRVVKFYSFERGKKLARFANLQIGPNRDHREVLNPAELERRERPLTRKALRNYEAIPKLYGFQYHLKPGLDFKKNLEGYNYGKSVEEITQQNLEDLQKYPNCELGFFAGVLAKDPRVLLDIDQPKHPGVDARAKYALGDQKGAWSGFLQRVFGYLNFVIGEEPISEKRKFMLQILHMSLGTLTPSHSTPGGVNFSRLHPACMDLHRLLDEAGIKKGSKAKGSKAYEEASQQILRLRQRWDQHTFAKAMEEDAEVRNAFAPGREKMDQKTRDAYDEAIKEMPELSPQLWLAKSYFVEALDPYIDNKSGDLTSKNMFDAGDDFMSSHAYGVHPILEKITSYHANSVTDDLGNGKDFSQELVEVLRKYGKLSFIPYDPFCSHALVEVASDPQLKAAFEIRKNVYNVDEVRMDAHPDEAEYLRDSMRACFEEAGFKLLDPTRKGDQVSLQC